MYIIGKHQNAYEEVNTTFLTQNNIYTARRLSGGGAVYHDEGNLNYSFVTKRAPNQNVDFERYTHYIIKALSNLGIKATLTGRNDLCIGEKKFSGNAQYLTNDKVLHHGTLMFDVNLQNMLNALNVSNIKIESKAIKSIKSRVINLIEVAPPNTDINILKEQILKEIFKGENADIYELTNEDKEAVKILAENKFAQKSYIFGTKFGYNITKKRKYPSGIVQADINITKNIITKFKISGDFFTNKDLEYAENALLGLAFNQSAITEKLKKINFDGYIKNFTTEEMIDLLFF